MNRTVAVRPLSLAIGFVLGVTVLLSMSQVSASRDCWGPPRKEIVNVFQAPPGATIPVGGSYTIFDVPNDRWLTVTGLTASGNGLNTALWVEDLNGVMTPKGNLILYTPTAMGNGGAIGWTFRPGSKVVMQNTSGSTPIQLFSYSLLGYLARE